MFINKINSVSTNTNFKGYQHIKNSVGETVMRFNYPYDYKDGNETCKVQIFKVIPTDKYNYKVIETPIYEFDLTPEGVEVNLQRKTNLDKDEAFAYKIIRKDKSGNVIWEGADTGVKMHPNNNGEQEFRIHLDDRWKDDKYTPLNSDGTQQLDKDGKPIVKNFGYHISSDFSGTSINEYKYTLVKRNGTTPMVQGPGYLAVPDSFMPGMRYKGFNENGTGELIYDKELQRKMEGMVKTFSNMYGGSIAGLEAYLPVLKENGFKLFFTTPIANGDNRSAHGYWNKNNMQIASNMGTSENYDSFVQKEFMHGIKHVFDATLTSEGAEGIHARYAEKWGDIFRLFRINGEKVSYGFVPNEAKNLRHRVINSPYKYELDSNGTYKKVVNNEYNPKKETLLQIYDASQVSEEQLSSLDKPIDRYNDLKAGKNLDITTYDDTLISYVFEINPNEYDKNINTINDLIKKEGRKIELNTPDGTLIASNMSNFSISRTSDGYVAWDDNPDMIKMNYGISPYDEKALQGIVDRTERQYEQDLRVRGSKMVQDMAVQTGKYWTDKTKTAHTLYLAQTLGNIKSAEKINELIAEGKLPQEVSVSQDVMDNILNGEYNLAPKGLLSRDDVTVKALMQLPLDTLEFGENTVSVLSTPFLINRATTDETIGKSRFELLKEDNPHLVSEYADVYNKMNEIFTNNLKDFAHLVIKKVNANSNEQLMTSDGKYTEYGEYVMELLGRNIAKYALLKSLSGDSFKYKILPDGKITYDYENIKNATTLKALGIKANNPKEEAEMLQKRIKKGLKNLTEQDVDALAKSIAITIKGTDTNTFRIAEALIDKAALELDFRLDAAKDVMDIDSIRNRDADFDDTWTNLIKFWSKYVKAVKSINPNSYIVAEMTDVADVMRDTFGGSSSCPYNGWTNVNGVKYNGEPDAMTKFFNETGITSEAAYSYFFTELLTNFSKEFESGRNFTQNHDAFKHKYDLLINTRSADYLRNLYTFMGNHDKTRTIHGLAVDMSLFQSTLMYNGSDFQNNHQQRLDVIRVLSGKNNISEVPLELRLNVDNLDYFRTVSARAVAQSKLLMDSVNEDLDGIASKEDIELIKQALADLANGNYLSSKISQKMTKINIPEISSLENAVKEVARIAREKGAVLTDAEIKSITEKLNELNIDDYAVRGDFNWGNEVKHIGDKNKEYLREILGTADGAMDYSLYTVQIARMIKEASKDSSKSEAINNALRQFVSTYNRAKISQNMDGFAMFEDFASARKKNSYGAQDFRTAIEEAIAQAEYKSGKKIANKDAIIATVYNSVTEPALKKHAMILSFLNGFCGIPTLYAGDEYGDTGYEDKAKNMWVRNRQASRRSEMDTNSLFGQIMSRNKDVTYDALRSKASVKPLQNGTPYSMDIMVGGKNRDEVIARIAEIDRICDKENGLNPNCKLVKDLRDEQDKLRLQLAKVAFMMQDGDGDMAISVFNAAGIDHNNRVNYFDKYGLKTKAQREQFFKDNNIESINPNNPYIPIQKKTEMDAILMGAGVAIPVGTIFINADTRDKTRYIVNKIGDRLGVIREDGKKIIMDSLTAKNGVMILRKVKNVAFRGSKNAYTQQYNILPNTYTKAEKAEIGKSLSLIAK